MRKLRIGLFNDSFPPDEDGVARVVENYAQVLNKNHAEVTVVKPKHRHVRYNYPFEVYQYPSVPLWKKIGYNAGFWLDIKTLNAMRQKKFDILHVHAPFTSYMLARIVARTMKIPLVFTYHTRYDIDIAKRFPIVSAQKRLIKFIANNIKKADDVWAVTEGCGHALHDIGYHGKYIVMQNGTDFTQGKAPKDKTDALRKQYNIEDDELVFIYAGRMMWYKNIGIILDTLKILKQNNIKYRAFFLGDGYDMPAIQRQVAYSGITKKVIFTGYVGDREVLRNYMSIADMFLFPSTYDTSGLVVKEAAACYCPTLLVKGSCAAEGVVHNHNGYLANENAESCAEVLMAACKNREHMKIVGQNAGNEIYLSWDQCVEQAYTRYIEVLSNWKK